MRTQSGPLAVETLEQLQRLVSEQRHLCPDPEAGGRPALALLAFLTHPAQALRSPDLPVPDIRHGAAGAAVGTAVVGTLAVEVLAADSRSKDQPSRAGQRRAGSQLGQQDNLAAEPQDSLALLGVLAAGLQGIHPAGLQDILDSILVVNSTVVGSRLRSLHTR